MKGVVLGLCPWLSIAIGPTLRQSDWDDVHLILNAIIMVRNEADIWAASLAHNLSLFDYLTVVDHQSIDGTLEMTEEAIRNGAPIELLHYRQRAHFQGQISALLAKRHLAAGCDWVFFVDADEFLQTGRQELEDNLRWTLSGVARFSWCNLAPTVWGSYQSFDVRQPFRRARKLGRLGKVAVSSAFLRRNPNMAISHGNHHVKKENRHRVQIAMPAKFRPRLLHVPIRSLDRLRVKLEWKQAGYYVSRDTTQADPLRDILECFDQASQQGALVDSITHYPTRVSDARQLTPQEVDLMPIEFLPATVAGASIMPSGSITVQEAMEREAQLSWERSPDSPPRLFVDGTEIIARSA